MKLKMDSNLFGARLDLAALRGHTVSSSLLDAAAALGNHRASTPLLSGADPGRVTAESTELRVSLHSVIIV